MEILQPDPVPVQVRENVLPAASSETSLVVVEVPTADRITPAVLILAAAAQESHLRVVLPVVLLPAVVAAEHRRLLSGNSDPVLN